MSEEDPGRRAKEIRRRQVRSVLRAALYLAPNFGGFLIFMLLPLFASLALSFTDYNLARHGSGQIPVRWLGLTNYARLLGFTEAPPVPELSDTSSAASPDGAWVRTPAPRVLPPSDATAATAVDSVDSVDSVDDAKDAAVATPAGERGGFSLSSWLLPSSPWGWMGLFFALVAAWIAAFFAAWRRRRPVAPGDANPEGRYLLAWLAGWFLLIVVAAAALDGQWSAQPRLGAAWSWLRLALGLALVGWPAWYVLRDDNPRDRRRLGIALLAVAYLLVGFWLMVRVGGVTFTLWEARTPRFWQFLYNTLFLMIGLPIGIAGALISALLLFRTFEIPSWRERLSWAGLAAGVTALAAWGLWRFVAGVPGEVVALTLLVGGVLTVGLACGTSGFRTLFYLPNLTMGVASFILWQKLFNADTGAINTALAGLFDTGPFTALESFIRWWNPSLAADWQLTPPQWLTSVVWSKPALILMGVWGALGSNTMLLYLAGLSNVPPELYEAADLDGASKWQRFWNVTWPSLAPTTFFAVVTGGIGGLQGGFEQARVMTGGGPAGSTTTLSYYLYNEAFELSNFGYGCAVAWVLFGLVMIMTLVNWRFGNEMMSYD